MLVSFTPPDLPFIALHWWLQWGRWYPARPVLQTEQPPPRRSAGLCGRHCVIARRFLRPHWFTITGSVWTGNGNGGRGEEEEDEEERGGGCGQTHRDLNSSRREERREEQQQAPQQQQQQPRVQPAWASRLASFSIVLRCRREPEGRFPPFPPLSPGPAASTPCSASRWWSLGFVGRAPTRRGRR